MLSAVGHEITFKANHQQGVLKLIGVPSYTNAQIHVSTISNAMQSDSVASGAMNS